MLDDRLQDMSWHAKYSADINRYALYARGSGFMQFLTQQGLWALLAYRISAAIYLGKSPGWIKRILLKVCVAWQKIVEIITGISIPYTTKIGSGLYIGHYGTIIVHPDTSIGENCNISQGVTIGISGRGDKRGAPIIGNRVYIAANAVVVGKIIIGDDVVIGANSLVNRDVPSHCTVLGVPAKIINEHGADDYLFPSEPS
ncbi:MAG: 2,3,4,5-tetrahydropyridine-2,6-dicarboxylate N-acetyltransferase [Gammaproteobacteria bacterium]|nr:2,3,4,5-tetrahydropyridine-2,6-dicarboxylate N-acetyltransferase [Gammaproteobacteria bacterium]